MRFHVLLTSVLLVLASAASPAFGQAWLFKNTKAPGLDVETWIQGEEFTIQDGTVYVVAFFELGDRYTRTFLLKLAKLQDEYESDGLKVIALTSDKEFDVRHYARRNEATISSLTIAIDRRGNTERAWRQILRDVVDERGSKLPKEAIEIKPVLFLVDLKGYMQSIATDPTHEYPGVHEFLQLVLDGRYDFDLWSRTYNVRREIDRARKVKNWRVCETYIREVIDTDKRVFAYHTHMLFELFLVDQKDTQKAYAYAREVIDEYSDDPKLLADLARKIVTDPKIPDQDRDFGVAMLAADAAAESFESSDPMGYSAKALVHFHQGEVEEAIRLQKKAYFLAQPSRKGTYKRVLETYQKGANPGANARIPN